MRRTGFIEKTSGVALHVQPLQLEEEWERKLLEEQELRHHQPFRSKERGTRYEEATVVLAPTLYAQRLEQRLLYVQLTQQHEVSDGVQEASQVQHARNQLQQHPLSTPRDVKGSTHVVTQPLPE